MTQPPAPISFALTGGRVLLPSGETVDTTVTVQDGQIREIGGAVPPGSAEWDVAGQLVLPGIIDLHGDAFERQLMPRPGVSFDPAFAFVETDRQLAANGITTAYHAMTHSWEPGLRGREAVAQYMAVIGSLQQRQAVDHRIHLRWETFNLDGVEELKTWLAGGKVQLLAFNNHMAGYQSKLDEPGGITATAQRAGMSDKEFAALVERVAARAEAVPAAISELAGVARSHGVAMASHDDNTREERHRFHALGCTICEFPMSREALGAADELGNPVVLGAPNVVRGGSQFTDRGVNAGTAVNEGLCGVLASDYYYPAMLQAPFTLQATQGWALGSVWALISSNAAAAAGLDDRGQIAVGRRADLVVMDDAQPRHPHVTRTLVAGRLAYQRDR